MPAVKKDFGNSELPNLLLGGKRGAAVGEDQLLSPAIQCASGAMTPFCLPAAPPRPKPYAIVAKGPTAEPSRDAFIESHLPLGPVKQFQKLRLVHRQKGLVRPATTRHFCCLLVIEVVAGSRSARAVTTTSANGIRGFSGRSADDVRTAACSRSRTASSRRICFMPGVESPYCRQNARTKSPLLTCLSACPRQYASFTPSRRRFRICISPHSRPPRYKIETKPRIPTHTRCISADAYQRKTSRPANAEDETHGPSAKN